MTAPVQTCAPEPDLFAGTLGAPVEPANAAVLVEIDGRLTHDAEVRNLPAGDGAHVHPVLCLELVPLSGLPRTICALQIFTEATRAQALATAKTLRKGMRVTLTSPPDDMRIKLPHITGVVVIQDR